MGVALSMATDEADLLAAGERWTWIESSTPDGYSSLFRKKYKRIVDSAICGHKLLCYLLFNAMPTEMIMSKDKRSPSGDD